MGVDTVALETDRARPATRARVDHATAVHYPGSRRIVLVADRGDFAAAQAALDELRDAVAPTEWLGCMDCGHAVRGDERGTPDP